MRALPAAATAVTSWPVSANSAGGGSVGKTLRRTPAPSTALGGQQFVDAPRAQLEALDVASPVAIVGAAEEIGVVSAGRGKSPSTRSSDVVENSGSIETAKKTRKGKGKGKQAQAQAVADAPVTESVPPKRVTRQAKRA